MLRSLHIKNIALIEDVLIDFSGGFSVFTGETGAGKSLVVDSLSLVLGARADRELISHGKQFAEVEAVFEDYGEDASQKLFDFGIDDEEVLILHRKIFEDGRNDCRVNGRTVTVGMLKSLASTLVDVCGQFENMTMFKSQNQLALLDSLAGNKHLLLELGDKLDEISEIDKKLEAIVGDDKERERALDMLAFQIDEIEEANFVPGEEETLLESHRKIVSKEKVVNSLAEALKVLKPEQMDEICSQIKSSSQLLSVAADAEPSVDELSKRLVSCSYEIDDIATSLEGILADYEDESIDVDAVEQRLDLLNNFKKKYGKTIEEILSFCDRAKERFDLLSNSKEMSDKLKNERAKIEEQAMAIAERLHESRVNVADEFSCKVQLELADLGMRGAKFEVQIDRLSNITKTGCDDVCFMFSANTGVPVRPLSKVASGGELSRFMLSLKCVSTIHDHIGTLVFDEIDTGVSGDTGRIVGEKMFQISSGRQILCISHLPTIASLADKNYFIKKTDDGVRTKTSVLILDAEQKIAEVARLVGGTSSSDHALLHAKEMVEESDKYKSNLQVE